MGPRRQRTLPLHPLPLRPVLRGLTMRLHLSGFLADLNARLLHGEHLALYGPRGSGKSTVLAELEGRLLRAGVPCGRAPATICLDDITRALARAYPAVDTEEVARRTARHRLWSAADQRSGVLLLDHLQDISNAMVSFLRRRLHGGVLGVLSAVDVDDEREREGMKPWRFGALSVRMPVTSRLRLRKLLDSRRRELHLPSLELRDECRLLAAARGRPGWIVKCTELERDGRYWRNDRLLVGVLCTDTQAAVRYRALELIRPPAGSARVTPSAAPPGL
ncbi:MAG TPA: ATP-binding protein [Steroidobacteraceae bacterium]|nr:ATP-binding protein [Steroidobacteraceae bacterium]